MRILLDLQGCQSVSRLRGIGRYSMALARAILAQAGAHEVWVALNDRMPETVEPIRAALSDLLPRQRVCCFAVPSVPENAATPGWRLRAAELVREHAIQQLNPDLVHISSLFEGYSDQAVTSIHALDTQIPVAVTLYDLIPYEDPATHLSDPGRRAYYYRRIEDLKRADVMLSISGFCATHAASLLSIPGERIVNISAAADPAFCVETPNPLESAGVATPPAISAKLAQAGITRAYVLCTGIVEPRKNLERLIQAYGAMPETLRGAYQLVIVCQPTQADRARLGELALASGLNPNDLVLLDYVSDSELIALYRGCALFVFPSLYEGFGLPALEAMACGAVVIGADATSVPEVIGDTQALFDPRDVPAMSQRMVRALTDPAYRQARVQHGLRQAQAFSWAQTGRRAIEAFEQCLAKRAAAADAASPPSAAQRYQALVSALGAIDAPLTEADLVATAAAIAANRPLQRAPELLVDVSELAVFDAKSGIQRVTRAIVRQWLDAPPPDRRIRLVRVDHSLRGYRYADTFAASLGVALPATAVADDWVETQAGDVFLGLDLVADRVPALAHWYRRQRLRQVEIYFLVYDILPIRHPHWFDSGTARCFPMWVRTIVQEADGLVCISRAVKDDLSAWIREREPDHWGRIKLDAFHLGADLRATLPTDGVDDAALNALTQMKSVPSALMVGTIEPRKGYRQALAAFEQLWRDGAEVNLVIVGKCGWGMAELEQTLLSHPQAGRRLFWLNKVSDEALERIYRAAAFLLAASEGEGFGLPLIEAAQFELPILARNLPVFREVAGEHAYYFDGADPAALSLAVRAWLELHAGARTPSSAGLPWLTWAQSAAQLKRIVLAGA